MTISIKQVLFIWLNLIPCICCAQPEDIEPYTEKDYGTYASERNWPFLYNKEDSTLIQCRRLNKKITVFPQSNTSKDISKFVEKPVSELTSTEKSQIATNACCTGDTNLLKLVLQFAEKDTEENKKELRIEYIKSLSLYNSKKNIRFLKNLLKEDDNELNMYAALALAQLKKDDISLEYIEKHYKEWGIKFVINDALIIMNTPKSIELLKKISEDKDPSNSLDALAALSLLGYCDYAFEGFKRYIKSDIWQVKKKVAWCLAYYIGTDEAFSLIKKIRLESNNDNLTQEIDKIFNIYK